MCYKNNVNDKMQIGIIGYGSYSFSDNMNIIMKLIESDKETKNKYDELNTLIEGLVYKKDYNLEIKYLKLTEKEFDDIYNKGESNGKIL